MLICVREGNLVNRASALTRSFVRLDAEFLIGTLQRIGIIPQLGINFLQALFHPALRYLSFQGMNRLLPLEALAKKIQKRNLHSRPMKCNALPARKSRFVTIKTSVAGDQRVSFKSVSSG